MSKGKWTQTPRVISSITQHKQKAKRSALSQQMAKQSKQKDYWKPRGQLFPNRWPNKANKKTIESQEVSSFPADGQTKQTKRLLKAKRSALSQQMAKQSKQKDYWMPRGQLFPSRWPNKANKKTIESQEVSSFPADGQTKQTKRQGQTKADIEPQQKYHLGMGGNISLGSGDGVLNSFYSCKTLAFGSAVFYIFINIQFLQRTSYSSEHHHRMSECLIV